MRKGGNWKVGNSRWKNGTGLRVYVLKSVAYLVYHPFDCVLQQAVILWDFLLEVLLNLG